eukprot:90676-Amphidinium_carterae.2
MFPKQRCTTSSPENFCIEIGESKPVHDISDSRTTPHHDIMRFMATWHVPKLSTMSVASRATKCSRSYAMQL